MYFIKNKGEFGNDFYIIIKGSAYVLIQESQKLLNEQKYKDNLVSSDEEDQEIDSHILVRDKLSKKQAEKLNPGFCIVNEMKAGKSFGEVALTSGGDRYE